MERRPSDLIRDGLPLDLTRCRSALGSGELGGRAVTLRGRHGAFRFPKVYPAEVLRECLETLGFRPAAGHRLYATTARSD